MFKIPSIFVVIILQIEFSQSDDWVFQTGRLAPGFTALFSTIGALRAPVFYRIWRASPPEAGKSKPPAVRVVIDSEGDSCI